MSSKTGSRAVQRAERQAKCVQLRKAGFTYQEISSQVGITRSAAYKLVAAAMAEHKTTSAQETQELRALEAARLDHATRSIWTQVLNGNHGAIDRLLRIMERRAKLLGLDMPTKVSPTSPDGENEYGGGGLSALLDAIASERASD